MTETLSNANRCYRSHQCSSLTKSDSKGIACFDFERSGRTFKKVAEQLQNQKSNKQKCLEFKATEQQKQQQKFNLISPNKYNHID